MDKINFLNHKSGGTPVNAANLNQMQTNIENALNNKADKMIGGTWTPIISTLEGIEPTVSYESREGIFRKIGNMVWISFYCRGKITALNGTNNYAFIKGLPFTNKDFPLGYQPLQIGTLYSLVNNNTNNTFNIYNNGIRIQSGYGGSATQLIVTTTSYFEIGGSGWYLIKE